MIIPGPSVARVQVGTDDLLEALEDPSEKTVLGASDGEPQQTEKWENMAGKILNKGVRNLEMAD